jgi:uncharacterized membrane protein
MGWVLLCSHLAATLICHDITRLTLGRLFLFRYYSPIHPLLLPVSLTCTFKAVSFPFHSILFYNDSLLGHVY